MTTRRPALVEFLLLGGLYIALVVPSVYAANAWFPHLVPFAWMPGIAVVCVLRYFLWRRGSFRKDEPDFPTQTDPGRSIRAHPTRTDLDRRR